MKILSIVLVLRSMYCAFLDMNPYLKNITIIDSSQQSPYTRWGRNTYVSVITSVAGSIHFDAMEVLIYKKVLYRNFLVNNSLFHYKKSIIHVIFVVVYEKILVHFVTRNGIRLETESGTDMFPTHIFSARWLKQRVTDPIIVIIDVSQKSA